MKNRTIRFDFWLLLPVSVLLVISLVTLYSINVEYFRTQIISILFALVAFFLFSQIDLRALRLLKIPIYLISLLVLGIVLVIGIESHGATRWISLFGTTIQFSEIVKPFLAIAFAAYLSERELGLKVFLTSILLLVPVTLLIYFQPDLGNTLIFIAVFGLLLFIYGFPFLWFALGFIFMALLSPVIWRQLHEYQRQRIVTFIHPTNDPLGTSYNVIQAVIAVGSGRFIGRGLSESTQSGLRFLPERHTDFIFATLSEGLGFLGSILVIIAFSVLLYRIIQIYRNVDTAFDRLFCSAAFCFILIHVFVNIGMNLGIIPIVGVTLPFVSFGGNSLLSNFISLGILSAISTAYKEKRVLEIR